MNTEIETVLAAYGIDGRAALVLDLGNAGGYSGANLWRVRWRAEDLCLRRWSPEYPDEDRLRFIHQVQQFAGQQLSFVPVPQRSRLGETYVRQGDCWWELTRWMPGTASYHDAPSPAKLAAAMHALAQFHRAVERFPGGQMATSPAMADRLRQIDQLQSGDLSRIRAALPHYVWPELRARGARIAQLFETHATTVRQQLQAAARIVVPLQPCLRDVWHDHVLFTDNEVTGLVDFGATRFESVAGDVERLLSSLVGVDREQWKTGLAAYEEVRPLDLGEQTLIEAFDSSGALLTGLVWLRWLLLDGRLFDDKDRILARLDVALTRLEHRKRALGPQIEPSGGS